MMLPERLSETVDAYLDGDLDPAQVDYLEAWLKADGANARLFAREVYLHRELRGRFQAQGDTECLEEASPQSSLPVLGWLADFSNWEVGRVAQLSKLLLITIVVGGTAAAAMIYRHNVNRESAVSEHIAAVSPTPPNVVHSAGANAPIGDARSVARLMRAWKAEWTDPTQSLNEWTPINEGQIVELSSGQVEVFFEVGAQLVLRGPIRFQVLGPKSGRLFYGDLTASVGDKARGFSLITSVGKVIDLGTAFGISVERNGRTDVVVFDGIVDLEHLPDRTDGAPSTTSDPNALLSRLTAGQAAQIRPDGTVQRIVTIDSNRFHWAATGVAPRREKATVIKSVSDSIHNPGAGPFYEIVHGGLGEDVQAYVDRPHEWNGVDTRGIPDALLGADYVKTFNDDKWRDTLEISLDIAQPADLYIFWDEHLKSVPRWLSEGFKDTGLKIGLDSAPYRDTQSSKTITVSNGVDLKPAVGAGNSIDGVYSVWHREVSQPGKVTLGPTGRKADALGAMYGVAAVAK